MPVHVNEIVTEVEAEGARLSEPETPNRSAESSVDWEEEARMRAIRSRLAAEDARTGAQGFDD